MAKSILVIGATGNVGMPLTKMLSENGYDVKAAVRSSTNVEDLRALGVETIQADLRNFFSLMNAMNLVEKVFFAVPFVSNFIPLSMNVIKAAEEAGVEHLVKISGSGAQYEAIQLARWHRSIEREMMKTGLHYTFLRPNSFMQNFVNFNSGTIGDHSSFYLPLGEGRVSYIDARDIASVAYHVLTEKGHDGQAYELTGPEAISCAQVASTLTNVLGKEITYCGITEEESRQMLIEEGLHESIVDARLELYQLNRLGYSAAITNTVTDITGKSPYTFEQFARDYKERFSR
ncbi:SDR family oxidoreductase [Pontibacillus yanchengensis]|uniref:FMN-dependent NADH-azoreductase n=1 Tax=Pontibacillus yanchengensis Y32 TaxID=1385514 RepID=A0A0A2TAM5_9BACI|nr:SDR family oxidoreductase [Pontibacillus yanchengensis]KGP72837.1 FMN-dependent NADH-azoreductase [Pontibacillus yanchengensis Y32]